MDYSPKFIEYFEHTQHAGQLAGDNILHSSHHSIQLFSDFELYLCVENNTIKEASFLSSTTPALIAAGEYACRWLEGKTLKQASGLQKEQILQELGLDATFVHVANLVCRVIVATLAK